MGLEAQPQIWGFSLFVSGQSIEHECYCCRLKGALSPPAIPCSPGPNAGPRRRLPGLPGHRRLRQRRGAALPAHRPLRPPDLAAPAAGGLAPRPLRQPLPDAAASVGTAAQHNHFLPAPHHHHHHSISPPACSCCWTSQCAFLLLLSLEWARTCVYSRRNKMVSQCQ